MRKVFVVGDKKTMGTTPTQREKNHLDTYLEGLGFDEFCFSATELREIVEDLFCPLCEAEVVRTGRCKTCPECGWSACEYG